MDRINILDTLLDIEITKVRIKKLHPDAKLPTKATPGAACYDVFSVETVYLHPHIVTMIRTGLAFEVPDGFYISIFPRSSVSKLADIVNSPGTLDSDYRGEMLVMLRAAPGLGQVIISKGERITQICLQKIEPVTFTEVEELNKTERGMKGFGSTGK